MKQHLSGDRQNGEDILLDVGDVEHEEIGPNPTRNGDMEQHDPVAVAEPANM